MRRADVVLRVGENRNQAVGVTIIPYVSDSLIDLVRDLDGEMGVHVTETRRNNREVISREIAAARDLAVRTNRPLRLTGIGGRTTILTSHLVGVESVQD